MIIAAALRAFAARRAAIGLVIAGAGALYVRTLRFGFDWDDYHFVRSYTIRDVIAAFAGPWDASGIEAPFYRPGTIAWFAGRDWLVGTDAVALHAFSLILLVCAAAAFAWWLRSLNLTPEAVLVGTLAFLVHPMMAPAVAWITNQMHLLQMILVAAALALASRARWHWLIPLQAAALLVKEDSLVLPLAIAGCLWAQRREAPRGWILASTFLSIGYVVVRTLVLGGVGGYEPGATEMLRNLARAPERALLVFPFNGGLLVAGALVAILFTPWWRGLGDRRNVLMAGLFALFNAPLAFSSGPTRWHLVAMAIAAALAVSVHSLRATRWAVPVSAAIVVGFAWAGWAATDEWRPCSAAVRGHDARALSWGPAVSEPLRQALASKGQSCGIE